MSVTRYVIDILHIMGMQPVWRTKQKKCSLLEIEIYSHVKKYFSCSVLQIGCIPTDVLGVYWHLVTVVVVVVVVVVVAAAVAVAVVDFAITLTAPWQKEYKISLFLIETCCCCCCCCYCCCRSYCTFAKKERKHCPFSIYRIRNVSSYHHNM